MNEIHGTDLQALEKKVLGFPEKANLIKVADQKALYDANNFLLTIKKMRKEITDTFDPIIKKAHEAHKEAVAQKKRHEAPLIEAEGIIKPQISAYVVEQDRIREEIKEEARLEREELERKAKEEEEKRLQTAKDAIEDGNMEEAEKILSQAPIEAELPPPSVMPLTPALVDGVSIKEIWKARVIDINKVPREYMIVDEAKIGRIARALKEETNIPGIEAYSEKSVAAKALC